MYEGSLGVKKHVIAAVNVLKNRYSDKESLDAIRILIKSFSEQHNVFHEESKATNDHIIVFLNEPVTTSFLDLCEALEAEFVASGIITRTVLHFGIVLESGEKKQTGVSLKNAHTMLAFMPNELSFAMTKAMKTECELNSVIRSEIINRLRFLESRFHCQTLSLFEPATTKHPTSEDREFCTELKFLNESNHTAAIEDSRSVETNHFTEKELSALKFRYKEYMGPMADYVVTALNRSMTNREDIIKKLTSDITSEKEKRVFQEKVKEDFKSLVGAL